MQTRVAVVVMVAAALWLGGCAGGGGLFRDRDDRAEAARLLIEREAEQERALQQSEEEAAAAQRALDEREQQALQEQDEDAERRKREEAEDLQQERRHRRERKEAEHDAEIRKLHKGSAAPKPPEKLPQHWLDYFSADEELGYAMIDAGKAAQKFAIAVANPAGRDDAMLYASDWNAALDALGSAQRNASAAELKAGISAPEVEQVYLDSLSSVFFDGMGGSYETIWESPIEEMQALLDSLVEAVSEVVRGGSLDAVAYRSKVLEWGKESERLGNISWSWNALMQAAFTPEVIAELQQLERLLIASEKAAAAFTEYAHKLSYCAHSGGTLEQWKECYDKRVHRLLLKANADGAKAVELLSGGVFDSIYDATRGESEAVKRALEAMDVAYQAMSGPYNDDAPSHSNADEAAAFEAAEKRALEKTRAWADAAVTLADAQRAMAAAQRAAVVEEIRAAIGAPQSAEAADQQAEAIEAAKQSAAANCYDGPKMLIRPHETMGDFEARCGPRTPTRADAAR